VRGHYWTLRPFFEHLFRPEAPPPSRHFRVHYRDPDQDRRVELTGRLQEAGSEDLVLVVHGLGGSHASNYAVAMAHACHREGLDCLRLDLRGADRRGGGLYHAGLVADLAGTLASPELARYRAIRVIGYSMGGHVALRYATLTPDPRVRCLVTVCSPVDLEAGVHEIDRPHRYLYRANVLRGLKSIYGATLDRGEIRLPLDRRGLARVHSIADWDEQVVAPHFGFGSARNYWRTQSVHTRLGELRVPTLAVLTRRDPMVLLHTVLPHLEAHPNIERIILDEGGHVGFPPAVDLGLGAPPGGAPVAEQMLDWMRAR